MDKSVTNNPIGNFNIRVYGLAIENQHILLSDERFRGVKMTKFPGGGLEFGEGTLDCLKREAMEEFGCSIEIISHFYTTDYFQPALFYNNTQLMSIYYLIKIDNSKKFPVSSLPIFPAAENEPNFRWAPLSELNTDMLTFPIDKKVAEMVINQFGA